MGDTRAPRPRPVSLPPPTHTRPPQTGIFARAPLPRPVPHKGPLSRRALELRFLKSFKRKIKERGKKKKKASAAKRAGSVGQGHGGGCSRRCSFQDPKAKGASGGPGELTRVLDYTWWWERWVVLFFYLKAEGGTPGTEAGGSRRAGAGFPAAAKGRSGVPVSGSAPARPQRPRQASPSPARSPPSLGSSAGETAGSSELSPPALPCQTQGVPAADRARPIGSRAASVPKLRDGGRPVSASLRRGPPALLPENKGSPGPWCCLPPGLRVLPRFPGDVGSSQGQPAAR